MSGFTATLICRLTGSLQTQTVEEEEVDEGLPDVHPAGETTGLICL